MSNINRLPIELLALIFAGVRESEQAVYSTVTRLRVL